LVREIQRVAECYIHAHAHAQVGRYCTVAHYSVLDAERRYNQRSRDVARRKGKKKENLLKKN